MKKIKRKSGGHVFRHTMFSVRRTFRFFVVVLLGYLIQITLLSYVSINGVTPNLCLCMIAVITVCYDRWHAYWTGAIYGILFEVMLRSVTSMSLLFYPVTAALGAAFFSDNSEKRLEELRSTNPHAQNGNVYIRTLLDVLLLTALYELVHLVFVYIAGNALTAQHLVRSLTNLLSTTILCALIMRPLRFILGFRKQAAPLRRSRYHDL